MPAITALLQEDGEGEEPPELSVPATPEHAWAKQEIPLSQIRWEIRTD